MNDLALEVDQVLRSVDEVTAIRLERLVRDALDLVKSSSPVSGEDQEREREGWLKRLDAIRTSVGTGRQGTCTEEILEDLRRDR